MTQFSFKFEAAILQTKMAEHLTKLRADRQLTMRELAGTLNESHSFISKIEKQNRRVSVGEFIHYCRALGHDPAKELDKFMRANTIAEIPVICGAD